MIYPQGTFQIMYYFSISIINIAFISNLDVDPRRDDDAFLLEC